MVKNPLASTRDIRDMGSIPGWGRSPGDGNGNPLQYSIAYQYITSKAGYVAGKLVSKMILMHFWSRALRKLIPVEIYLQALILE